MTLAKYCLVFISCILTLQNCETIKICEFFGLSLPSDKTLEINFRNNKEELEKLNNLFQEDNGFFSIRLYSDNYYLNPKGERVFLTPPRFQEYKTLMKKSKIAEGLYRNSNYKDAVFFQVNSVVVDNSDPYQTFIDEKGYVYSEKDLTPILESLDNSKKIVEGIGFKKIDKNWYIYYAMKIGKPE